MGRAKWQLGQFPATPLFGHWLDSQRKITSELRVNVEL
jgi:hypothetical protein